MYSNFNFFFNFFIFLNINLILFSILILLFLFLLYIIKYNIHKIYYLRCKFYTEIHQIPWMKDRIVVCAGESVDNADL